MRRKLLSTVIVALLLIGIPSGLQAKSPDPFQIEAEVIEYNSTTGQMLASGANGVKLTQAALVMTGERADYNMKTQAGIMTGNVKAIQDTMTLTADQVEAKENQQMIATGRVLLTKDGDRLYAPRIDYYSDRQVAIVEKDAKLITADSMITSDRLESFFREKRSVAKGNVIIVSEQRNLQARADHAIYYETQPGQQGKIVLTGNARAVQDGNTIVGETLTLYMDDKAVDATGRTKVVIAPVSN